LLSSADNNFHDVIADVELTVLAASDETVTVEVAKSQTSVVEAVQDFVDAFNSIRSNLDTVTAFDEEELTTGILFGTTAALRVESDLNRILSGRFFGVGDVTTLAELGITFDDAGKLEFDTQQFQDAFGADPAAVERFFTDETLGVAAKLNTVIEQLAGDDDSVLVTRAETLADILETNQERVTFMEERLARERERLLIQFAQLESTIAALQQNLIALDGLQIIPPLTSTQSN
jgi:flagellar hook-associated protein 2